MRPYSKKIFYLFFFAVTVSCNTPGGNENTTLLFKTTLGDMKIKLYDTTPRHRDNFIRLVNSGFYNGMSFHRIIKNFMIQAGEPASKSGSLKNLPDSIKTYTIPAEINKANFHKKGALAAARQGNDVNPQMRSSGTQFYIVQGVTLTDDDLNQAEQRINSNMKQSKFNNLLKETSDSLRLAGKSATDGEIQQLASIKMFQFLTSYNDYKISEEQRHIYRTSGGTPRLDGTYTVFGEVIEGIEILDKIAEVKTDSNDKPLNDVKIIKIQILKN
jgi:peptidylprolyl isomerase